MKKILVAMIIAVIAVAGVFAATTNGATQLNLQYKIQNTWKPEFTINYITGNVAIADSLGSLSITTEATENNNNAIDNVITFGDENTEEFSAGYVAVALIDKTSYCLKTTGRSIIYSVSLLDGSNSSTSCKWVNGTTEGPEITLSAIDNTKKTTELTARGITTAVSSSTTEKTLTVTYEGSNVAHTSTSDVVALEVGRLSASWDAGANEDLAAGTYTATMVVTVTGI